MDYSNTVIYQLTCPTFNDIYVNYTQNLKSRKFIYSNMYIETDICKTIRLHGGFDNWKMVILEKYEDCQSKEDAKNKVQDWISKLTPRSTEETDDDTDTEFDINQCELLKEIHKEKEFEELYYEFGLLEHVTKNVQDTKQQTINEIIPPNSSEEVVKQQEGIINKEFEKIEKNIEKYKEYLHKIYENLLIEKIVKKTLGIYKERLKKEISTKKMIEDKLAIQTEPVMQQIMQLAIEQQDIIIQVITKEIETFVIQKTEAMKKRKKIIKQKERIMDDIIHEKEEVGIMQEVLTQQMSE